MTDKKKIMNIIELFIAWNGETEPIDTANLDSAVDFVADSMQEEPVSEDLEKEIDRVFFKNECDSQRLHHKEIADIARHFAAWQKQQMMNDAVDGKVQESVDTDSLWVMQDGWFSGIKYGLTKGDKVKLIIVKEE